MAKLGAHGQEIHRMEFDTYRLAFMSDGNILRNDGAGWKTYKKVKKGFDVRAVSETAQKRNQDNQAKYPAWAAWTQAMIRSERLEDRWKIKHAIALLPSDPDGVKSELEDNGINLSVEDVQDLCRLFLMCQEERKRMAKALAQEAKSSPA